MRPFIVAILLSTAALLVPTAGLSNSGGSGGGGGVPSTTAPSFDAAAEYRKGIEALQAQRFAEARKSFVRVLDVADRDANINYLAGLAYAGEGNLKNARKHFEKAVRNDEKMVAAHQELGVTSAKLGDRAKAEKALASLKEMAAKCAGACADAAKLAGAVAAVEGAMGAGPQARIDTRPSLLFTSAAGGDRAYLDAVSLINERRYEEAITAFEAARAAFGAHPDVLTYLGFAHRKLGRFEVAEDHYRQALALAPGHRGATEYYGELMVERGDMAGARQMLAKLEAGCAFGCAEADELRRWIEQGRSPAS